MDYKSRLFTINVVFLAIRFYWYRNLCCIQETNHRNQSIKIPSFHEIVPQRKKSEQKGPRGASPLEDAAAAT